MAQKRRDPLEDARNGVLDALTDTIEHLQRRKARASAGEDGEPTQEASAPAEEQRGDFAHDVLQLNVQYLNQLSRLGSSYSIIASRALEKLYDYFGPKEETEAEEELTPNTSRRSVTGIVGETRLIALRLHNPNACAVSFSLVARDDAATVVCAPMPQELMPREDCVVKLHIHIAPALVLGQPYVVKVRAVDLKEERSSTLGKAGPAPVRIEPNELLIKRVRE